MMKETQHKQAFWRGVCSAFSLFPVDRAARRAELLEQCQPDRLLERSWQDVGDCLRAAMGRIHRKDD